MNSVDDQLPRGCCGETIVNFSMLELPDVCCLNLHDPFLFLASVVIFTEPYLKFLAVQERKTHFLGHLLKKTMTYEGYIILSFSHNMAVFIVFNIAALRQPRIEDIQVYEVMALGMLLSMAGFCAEFAYYYYPISTVFGRHYFRRRTVVGEYDVLKFDQYSYHLAMASVLCYFGIALIYASAAGIFLTCVKGAGYYTSYILKDTVLKH